MLSYSLRCACIQWLVLQDCQVNPFTRLASLHHQQMLPNIKADLQEDDLPEPSAASVPTSDPAAAADTEAKGKGKGKGSKKRSGEEIIEKEKDRAKKAKEDAAKKVEWFELKQNTSVYISGLPSDVTEEEVVQVGHVRNKPLLQNLVMCSMGCTSNIQPAESGLLPFSVCILQAEGVQLSMISNKVVS